MAFLYQLIVLGLFLTDLFSLPSDQKPSETKLIDCPKSLCDGYKDGYYAHADSIHHFVRCVKGYAFCQQCSPATFEYSVRCNQCLYKKSEDGCDDENPFLKLIVSNFFCPDACVERKDEKITGMIADPYSKRQFVACWKGKTIGCLSCPRDLIYNEEENSCLFEGGFKSEGENDYIDYVASF